MTAGFDVLFNVLDDAIFPNEDGPASRIGSVCIHDSVSFGHFLAGITEYGIIEFQAFCELGVFFDRITARCKNGNVVFPKCFAALTERLAFGRSARGGCFRIPRDDDGLFVLEFGQFVRFAVASF